MNWPEENKPAVFRDLAGPLRELFLQCAKCVRHHKDRDAKWNGLSQGPRQATGCLEPEDGFTAANLKYSLEDQGRDFLDEFIGLCIQLGMEQGRRVEVSSSARDLERMQLRTAADMLNSIMEERAR